MKDLKLNQYMKQIVLFCRGVGGMVYQCKRKKDGTRDRRYNPVPQFYIRPWNEVIVCRYRSRLDFLDYFATKAVEVYRAK